MESKTGRRCEVSWDGKMYNKYKIEHTDGTPLKGKKYFVLRLDSDDQIEAARVARAMRAYEGKLRNCDVGTPEEQKVRWRRNCGHGIPNCWHCKVYAKAKESGLVSDRGLLRCDCKFIWAQMPYAAEQKGDGDA